MGDAEKTGPGSNERLTAESSVSMGEILQSALQGKDSQGARLTPHRAPLSQDDRLPGDIVAVIIVNVRL